MIAGLAKVHRYAPDAMPDMRCLEWIGLSYFRRLIIPNGVRAMSCE